MAYHDSRGRPSESYLPPPAGGSNDPYASGSGPSGGGSSSASHSRYPPPSLPSSSTSSSYPQSQHAQSHRQHPQYPPHSQQQHHQPSHPHNSHPSQHASSLHQAHYPQPPHHHHPQQSPSSHTYGSPYEYGGQLPVFPYGYPSFAPSNPGLSSSHYGQTHRNSHNEASGSSNNMSNNMLSSAYSYFDADQHSGAMAPLPEHIEAGIMGASSWLLQPGGIMVMDNADGESKSSSGNNGSSTQAAAPPGTSNAGGNSSSVNANHSSPSTSPSVSTHAISLTNLNNPTSVSPRSQNIPPPRGNANASPPTGAHGTSNSSSYSQSGQLSNQSNQPPSQAQGFSTSSDPLGQDLTGWRLNVDPFPFSSGLEGISGLPIEVFHAAATAPAHAVIDRRTSDWGPAHEEEVKLLDSYLGELVSLMEPFALTPSNPAPPPPPPYLHTRISRLATLVRETLASLESRSQPLLDAQFAQLPPGDSEVSEAEREMDLIRRRRDVLIAKAAQGKRDLAGLPPRHMQPPTAQMAYDNRGRMIGLAPRPQRELWRCHGCGTTTSNEWKGGPDGPSSLCENCGNHYERLVRKGGDGDFSSVPGYNSIGLGNFGGPN